MKNSQELKDLHGSSYVEQFEKGQSPKRLSRLTTLFTLNTTMEVADFACGNGMMLEHIAPQVKSYYGVDFSPPFIEAAKKRQKQLGIHNAKFFCDDINHFCKDHQHFFDQAFAMDFSEHVYDEDWINILKSIHSSLKPNGAFYIHTPNGDFFLEKMKAKNILVKQFPEHIAVRSIQENVNLLKEAGFNKVKLNLLPHYNILKFLHPLSFLPILGKYFKARIFIEAIK